MDLQNELREAWNAIQILMQNRLSLRDLFIAYQLRFDRIKTQVKKLSEVIVQY